MPAFVVEREANVLVTLHEGTDSTARRTARDRLDRSLSATTADSDGSKETASASADGRTEPVDGGSNSADDRPEWQLGEATVYEGPTAPFEPYTIAVPVAVSLIVEAPTDDAAIEEGSERIHELLRRVDGTGVEYDDPAVVRAA